MIGSTIQFFKNKKALSPETAITMTNIDWLEAGFTFNPVQWWAWPLTKWLKKTPNHTYYIDLPELEREMQPSTQFLRFVQIFSIVMILGILLFGVIMFFEGL